MTDTVVLIYIFTQSENGAHNGATEIVVIVAAQVYYEETEQVGFLILYQMAVIFEYGLKERHIVGRQLFASLLQLQEERKTDFAVIAYVGKEFLFHLHEELAQQRQVVVIVRPAVHDQRVEMPFYIGELKLLVIRIRLTEIVYYQFEVDRFQYIFGEIVFVEISIDNREEENCVHIMLRAHSLDGIIAHTEIYTETVNDGYSRRFVKQDVAEFGLAVV